MGVKVLMLLLCVEIVPFMCDLDFLWFTPVRHRGGKPVIQRLSTASSVTISHRVIASTN